MKTARRDKIGASLVGEGAMDQDRSGGRLLSQTLIATAFAAALLLASAGRAQAQGNSELAALIDDLVAANRILYHQGVLDGFGHVSVRHPTRPDHFLMAKAIAPGRAT